MFSQLPVKASSHLDAGNIVSVDNLVWVKSYEYAFMAIKVWWIKKINVNYQIIGNGRAYQQLMFAVHDFGLEDSIQLLSRLKPLEVHNELGEADIFLL